MTLLQSLKADALTGVQETDTPEGLSVIHRADCAATMWRRTPSQRFQTWIDALPPESLPRTRVILRPETVREATCHICDVCGTPEGFERDSLVDDATALTYIFAHITKTRFLRLRFDVITSNACRKFHIDAVTARLICTYRGTGTQIGVGAQGAEPREILTVPTGAPIVLRGTLWPERPTSGLLHRSPPIEGTGETRLLFVLDPVLDPDDQPEQKFIH